MLEIVGDDSKDVERDHKAHCKRLLKRVKSFEKPLKERAKQWKEARKYVNGDAGGDDGKGLVRINLIGSILETVQPTYYAKAPEIAVSLDEHIESSDYPVLKPFAETLEAALNVFLVKDAKLKARGKSCVRASLTSTLGWVKVAYQLVKQEDPLIRNRINDTQDNVDRINALIKETGDEGGQCAEHEAKIFELKQQISALQNQIEVVVSEGLVIDTVSVDDIIVMDSSCRDIEDFMQAPEIAHKIKMSVAAFKEQFGKSPPEGSRQYIDSIDDDDEKGGVDVDPDDKMVCVYEVWSKKDLTVYTLVEGSCTYAREPYQPIMQGEQWYPFFGLQLRRVEGEKYPRSLVEQLIELQDEFNTRSTNAAEHRKKNIPVRIFNKTSLTSTEEITAINNRTIHTDVIGVTMDANTPLQQQLGSLPEIPYNPMMYDTSDVMRNMEMVGNAQDASRGAINKAKTATEAEIMSAGMQSRTSEALDVIEDWLSEIASYAAQLLLQHMPVAIIKRRFGETAVWPEIDKESLFKMVNINIRAGSTGQPNRMRERDQWLQLMPMIQASIEKIAIYKQQNMPELVETTIKLLDETINRFDEKLDAKELLGITEEADGMEEPQQPPGIPPEIQAQIQQMQEQMQQASQEIEQGKKELEQRAIQMKVEKIQQDAQNSVAKAQAQSVLEKIKAESDALAAQEDQFKLIQQHALELQSLSAVSQDDGKSAELAASMAEMNQQLQVQIAAVMQSLAATNELLSAPKQVVTPSGQVYTMSVQ